MLQQNYAGNGHYLVAAQPTKLDNSAVPDWHYMPGGCLENRWSLVLIGKTKELHSVSIKHGNSNSSCNNEQINSLAKKKIHQEDKDILALSSKFLISGVHFQRCYLILEKDFSRNLLFYEIPFVFLGFSFNLSQAKNNGVRETL